jgi:DNA modification methylase
VTAWTDSLRQLELSETASLKLTHQLFRYPAKFHPPVVAKLLEQYTQPGDLVLDPFAGSGTALVEAMTRGRKSIGSDIDPVAAVVSRAKTRRYDLDEVDKVASTLTGSLSISERPSGEYERLMFDDISQDDYESTVADQELWIPAIPNLYHWFRRYVLLDLSIILRSIESTDTSPATRALLKLVFASIIRNSSNADPVPVSGLEYTSHMRKKDHAGRLVNPFALFRTALRRTQAAVKEYAERLPEGASEPLIFTADSVTMPIKSETVDAVITSPPYHNAVDYYRRHLLEMYWLSQVVTPADRLLLLPKYIGRPRVSAKNPLLALPWNPPPLTGTWEERIRIVSGERANDFKHYVQAMTRTFEEMTRVMKDGAVATMVVGHSTWNGNEIPTVDLFQELAENLKLIEVLQYPVKNRYMSYTRRNNASIDREYVLVFHKAP